MEWPTAMAAFLLADAAGQPPELGRQVAVAAAGGGPGALGQHLTQPAVALGGPARATLAPGHVVAGAAARPGGKVPGGGEHRHVDADLGNDGLGGPLADPGDGVEAVTGPGDGAMTRSTAMSSSAMDRSSCSTWSRASRTSRAWWAPKRPRSASRSSGSLLRSRPRASSARTLGSRSPASSARSIARPETPSTSAATEPSRIEASSRILWMRWHSAVWVWKGPLAVAGQVPQLADGRRRDEAA